MINLLDDVGGPLQQPPCKQRNTKTAPADHCAQALQQDWHQPALRVRLTNQGTSSRDPAWPMRKDWAQLSPTPEMAVSTWEFVPIGDGDQQVAASCTRGDVPMAKLGSSLVNKELATSQL